MILKVQLMIFDKIFSLKQYTQLFERFKRIGSISNNYLLPDELEYYINTGRISYVEEGENIFYLVKQETCYRVYYQLNNLQRLVEFAHDNNYAIEILYRGEKCYPLREIDYWEKCGFQVNLVRDFYQGVYSNMNVAGINTEVEISLAKNEVDVLNAIELFNQSFDSYTGDYVDESLTSMIYENKQLLVAYIDGRAVGFCHFYEKNKAVYLAHIVVNKNYRGRKIGYQLVVAMIKSNMKDPKTRYTLWVQQKNESAVKMYQSVGYKYAGKSTISLLKTK